MDTIVLVCEACKKKLGVSAKEAGRKGTCPVCGAKILIPKRQAPRRASQRTSAVSRPQPDAQDDAESEKHILPVLLLCFFLGLIGVHRFYTGKIVTGIIQALTLGGLFIWVLIDLIMIIIGAFKDKEGNRITEWT